MNKNHKNLTVTECQDMDSEHAERNAFRFSYSKLSCQNSQQGGTFILIIDLKI